ncbi:DsrE family protein [Amaricoccus sp.]|uniref:DsrE family protein n=1 Tax=Amaricoccus sp. TaxID=1872485 RepID=UPI001B5DB899|nr:DsrE family protein [Amaricoccus sp.]MBP6999935.1 DsrE family protein [Amaricoccus sp.]
MTHRPSSLAGVAAAALFLALPAGGFAADYADQKVVYHNNGGDADYFTRFLGNITNHIDAVGADHLRIVVIDHGDGLDLFEAMAADPKIARRVETLRGEGVRFLICQKTLTARDVDWHDLPGVTEADIVPSGVAEIARLQGDGYVYIHP